MLQQSEAKELEKSQQLELTLRQLQQTQAQLIISEKKYSLDQVVAGIAHEINNAINIDSERVAISIADNGIGMVEDVKKRVFDPFFTTKEIGSGRGLGLSMCYQIVADTHGGQLFCESETGVGTTFTIVLPVKHSK